MESVGHKSSRLERPSAWNGQETLEKKWKNAASRGEPEEEDEPDDDGDDDDDADADADAGGGGGDDDEMSTERMRM